MRPSVQIAYNTDRFDETVAFWTETLGLTFQRGWDDAASRGALIELNENTVVEVFAAPHGAKPWYRPRPTVSKSWSRLMTSTTGTAN